MSNLRTAFAAGLLCTAAVAAAAPPSPELAIKFGERASFYGASISPDGSKVTYITPITGRGSALMIADTTTGEVKPVMTTGDPKVTLRTCYWAKADRIICRLTTITKAVGGYTLPVSRLYSISPDGKEIKEIGRKLADRSLGINTNSGSVLNLMPESSDDVLMAVYNDEKDSINTNIRPKPPGLAGQMVNLRTARMRMVEQPIRDADEFIADASGRIRVKGLSDCKETADYGCSLAKQYKYLYRTRTSDNWLPLGTADLSKYLTLSVEGFDTTGDWLYIYKPKDGRRALYKFAADGSGREELVYSRPDADIDGIYRIGKQQRPIGASYSTDYNHIEYFDPDLKALTTRLRRALPGTPEVSIVDETWDGQKLFIQASSDVDPGAFYIYDRAAKRLAKLSAARPKLEGMTLAEQKPVTFAAADGTQIPAYLTLPPGKDARNLPLVVMPHGGPTARDYWGFDWLPQYFAALGYAVVQPNYRGSAGYGADWFRDNGYKGWRTAIGDVNDSARWLVKQGVADPKRLVIFGWSYGGYAALQTNVLDPTLYKAIVAVAPVTDLPKKREDARDFGDFRIVAEFIGTGPESIEGSPARNAAKIQAPVLLFHGDLDINVDVEQSRVMASALKSVGKPVELVVYPDLEHSLVDDRVRADLLLKSARFFEANLK